MAGSDSECFLLVSGGKQDKMREKYTFEEFVNIIEMLRSENGCPWDREQTHESLRSCMMEEAAELLARHGIAVRAGLHCAPLAHESAGTLDTGTVRISFGHDANPGQVKALISACAKVIPLS